MQECTIILDNVYLETQNKEQFLSSKPKEIIIIYLRQMRLSQNSEINKSYIYICFAFLYIAFKKNGLLWLLNTSRGKLVKTTIHLIFKGRMQPKNFI